MDILKQHLKNLGLGKYEDLSPDDKDVYKSWESALSGRQITDKEVRDFMDIELEEAIQQLIAQRLGDKEDTFLKMKVDFIRKLNSFLDMPKREKEQVEQLIKNQS